MRGNLPRSKKQRKTVRVSLSLCLYFSNQGSATEQQITARKDTTFFFQARHNISLLLQRWGLFLIVTDRRNSQAEVEEKRISGTFNGHSVIHVYTRLYLHDRFEVWEWKLICHQHRQRDRLNYLHIFPAFISTTIILSDKITQRENLANHTSVQTLHVNEDCGQFVLYGEWPNLENLKENKIIFIMLDDILSTK